MSQDEEVVQFPVVLLECLMADKLVSEARLLFTLLRYSSTLGLTAEHELPGAAVRRAMRYPSANLLRFQVLVDLLSARKIRKRRLFDKLHYAHGQGGTLSWQFSATAMELLRIRTPLRAREFLAFRSFPAMRLYVYLSAHNGPMTEFKPWRDWQTFLQGGATYQESRYFKRAVLSPSMEELKEHANLVVETVTKRVDQEAWLAFAVSA